MQEITEAKFQAYEEVRHSGVTNMFDLETVCALSGLSREEAVAIMKQYRCLMERYPRVRQP